MKKRLWLIMALGPFFVSPALAGEAHVGEAQGMKDYKPGSFLCGHNKHALIKDLSAEDHSDQEKKADEKADAAI